jgi:deoxyribodipyrimidine photo-lyase
MRRVPDTWLFEPWRMSADTQTRCGVQIDRDYPAPVVDFTASMRWAKQQFAQWRQQPQLREQSRLVYLKHGSRASRDEREARPRKPVPSAQLALFGEDD